MHFLTRSPYFLYPFWAPIYFMTATLSLERQCFAASGLPVLTDITPVAFCVLVLSRAA